MYSYLLLDFKGYSSAEELRPIVSKFCPMEKYSISSSVALDRFELTIRSNKNNSLEILLKFALELFSYLRLKGETNKIKGVILNSQDELFPFATFIPQIASRVIQGLRIKRAKEFLIPYGYFAVQVNSYKLVKKLYPKIWGYIMPPQLPLVDFSPFGFFSRFFCIDLWKTLEISGEENRILLSSNLTTKIADSLSDSLKELIFNIARSPKIVATLNPRKVEELIAALIIDKGFEVQLTAMTRDGGRDIIALRGKGALLKNEKYLIEVKHPQPQKAVSVGAVRELVGVGEVEPSTGLIIVSTSRFTRDAKEYAEMERLRHSLALKDYNDIIAWVKEYCEKRG